MISRTLKDMHIALSLFKPYMLYKATQCQILPTCKLTHQPSTILWIRQKIQFLIQRQRTLLPTRRPVARVLAFSCACFQGPNSHIVKCRTPGDTCKHCGLWGRYTELWDPNSFIIDSKHTYPLFQREVLFLCALTVLCTNILVRMVQDPCCQCLCSAEIESQKTPGEWFPNYSINKSKINFIKIFRSLLIDNDFVCYMCIYVYVCV